MPRKKAKTPELEFRMRVTTLIRSLPIIMAIASFLF